MSRKETIIIAVILNIGLLALLFVFATREEDEIIEKSELSQTVVEVFEPVRSQTQTSQLTLTTHEPSIDTGADEVDIVLKDFAMHPRGHSDLSSSIGEEYSPPALPPPSAFNSDEYVEVTVKRGDALEKIARANGTTVDSIKQANRLTTDKLKIGQVLLIPIEQKSVAIAKESSTKKEPARVSGDSKVYTVKSGDNPWKIAKQFHISVDELLQANRLDEERARNLKVGQQLQIP